jgi:hypothetical protein
MSCITRVWPIFIHIISLQTNGELKQFTLYTMHYFFALPQIPLTLGSRHRNRTLFFTSMRNA